MTAVAFITIRNASSTMMAAEVRSTNARSGTVGPQEDLHRQHRGRVGDAAAARRR